MNNQLDRLNKAQRQAVLWTQGPLRITATAGSGKTRVITSKIIYLIQTQQVASRTICAFTFTNKASREMQQRLDQQLEHHQATIQTFHKFCYQLLLRALPQSKYPYAQHFTIVDQRDCTAFLRQKYQQAHPFADQATLKQEVSFLTQQMAFLASHKLQYDYHQNDWEPYHQKLYETYLLAYEADKQERNVISLDDFIPLATSLLQQNEALKAFYQKRYHYFFIDEFQDTNQSQFAFFRTLTSHTNQLNFVGDANQAIYGWRGADRTLMVQLQQYYPNLHTITLLQNYRSTANVIQAANSVLANRKHFEAAIQLVTTRQKQHRLEVELYVGSNVNAELEHLVRQIKQLTTVYDYRYADITVLYRLNRQATLLEEKLTQQRIPYHKWGQNFLNYQVIQRLLQWYRLLIQVDDLTTWGLMLTGLPSFGPQTTQRLISFCANNKTTPNQLLHHADGLALLNKNQRTIYLQFVELYETARQFLQQPHLTEADICAEWSKLLRSSAFLLNFCCQQAYETAVWKKIHQQYVAYHSKSQKPHDYFWDYHRLMMFQTILAERIHEQKEYFEHFAQLLRAILDDFLLDAGEHEAEETDANRIQLMTVHKAKGTENKIIMLFTLCEGMFPLTFANSDLNEEARLFYVALTRAQHNVYLSYPRTMQNWTGKSTTTTPSRFLQNLKVHQSTDQTILVAQSQNNSFAVNDRVYNKIYGKGTVKVILRTNCLVQFDQYGIRTVPAVNLKIERKRTDHDA